jgi:predicted nucleic acid-binding protein
MVQPVSGTDYFDSSALVKRYFAEIGSAWVQKRCNDSARTTVTADISRVEIAAAFAGKYRGGFITRLEYRKAHAKLRTDVLKRFQLLPITSERIDEAIALTGSHRLRGYDAVHLACVLYANQTLIDSNLPSLVVFAADSDLLKAAEAEGLNTENPNRYPQD